ncbi:MAG: F0F1 ATP synthase subunit delta [bacterium]
MAKISPKNIAEAIYCATEGKSASAVEPLFKRGAQLLKDKRMLGKSREVLSALEGLIEKKSGAVRMKVTTAKVLNLAERKKVEEQVMEKYKARTVIGEFFEKAELLGGMRVEVGDEVTDTTYKNQLRQLENFLMR